MQIFTGARRWLALVAVATGCAAPRPGVAAPAAVTTPAEVSAAARATLEQWRQAYEVRSADALARLYVHDPGLSVIQDGTLLLGWSAVEPMLRDRLGKASAVRVRIKDVQVSAVGLTGAVVVAAMLRERSEAATTVTENGVITLVLARDDAGWAILCEHYSYKRP